MMLEAPRFGWTTHFKDLTLPVLNLLRMKRKTTKASKTAIKLKDLKPKKNARGGARANTIGGTRA